MATEKEILLYFLNGDSQRRIASSLKVSRNTVSRIVAAYMAQKLEASDVSGLTSEALHERLFPPDGMSSLVAARLPTPFWTVSSTAPINWK